MAISPIIQAATDSDTPPPALDEPSAPDAQAPAQHGGELCHHEPTSGLAARGGMGLIRFYQRAISPLTPPACRFQPTCSEYTLIAIKRHGFVRGCWLGLLRILRCHPFHPGGHDPVP